MQPFPQMSCMGIPYLLSFGGQSHVIIRAIKRARSVKSSPGVISSHVVFILQRLPPYPPAARNSSARAFLERYQAAVR